MKTTTARTEKEKGSMVILTFFFSCLFLSFCRRSIKNIVSERRKYEGY